MPDLPSAHILALETELVCPDTRTNPTRLRELLCGAFTEIGASGRTYNRDAIIAALVSEPARTLSLSDFEVAPLSEDIVLATYRLVAGDAGARTESLRSSLWVRDGDDWRLRFHQGTPIP